MLLNLLGIKIHENGANGAAEDSSMTSRSQSASLNDEWLVRYLSKHDSILKCRAALLLEENKFKELYSLLSTHQFDPAHYNDLQAIWYKGHYAEVQKTRGRPLGAVDKYRIRRKYPLPGTIWDGEETVYCFKVTLTIKYIFNLLKIGFILTFFLYLNE